MLLTNETQDQESFGRFFLPGPTEVREAVLLAQTRAMMGHRGAGVQELIARLQVGLKDVFQTTRPVFISTSSATGLMEAAVRNGASRKVLSLVNGAFSERFAKIARACGPDVDVLEVPWGESVSVEQVADRLSGRRYDAITVVHSETSTGVLNPVAELAEYLASVEGTLLLVDSVTGVGGAEVQSDAWGLDFVLTGSQKALALPPGLAFGVASDAMMERSAQMEGKGVYFDLGAFASNMEKFQTPTTPALSLMYALDEQLRYIAEETMPGRWARHIAMRNRCVEWVGEMAGRGCGVLAPEGFRSPTVTCITLPEGRTGPGMAAAMKERGYVIGAGYGRLKEGSIRIGHMGDHTVDELDRLLEDLREVLA
jgi:aspartate aminotransferase-like enzyme